jgi:hypothetical protein
MSDSLDDDDDKPTVRHGQSDLSPETGPADSLRLALAPGSIFGLPSLMLHGALHIGSATEGRYSGGMPGAVLVVAVSREAGRAYLGPLVNEDDIPPIYRGDDAPPAITRMTPGGPVPDGTLEVWFSVDLKRHLGLPDAAGTYDVFLWLDAVLSELATAEKPADPGNSPGTRVGERPAELATIRAAPASDRLDLAAERRGTARIIQGECGAGRVTVIAHAVQSRATRWMVLEALPGPGTAFELDAAALLPEARPEDRILVLAVAAGRRSALLTVPALG